MSECGVEYETGVWILYVSAADQDVRPHLCVGVTMRRPTAMRQSVQCAVLVSRGYSEPRRSE